MSRLDFKVETNLLDWRSPTVLDIKVVDRAVLEDSDLDYILSCLPPEHMARVDSVNYKPYIGIDIFYDQEASLKGVVFAFGNRALAIRVPANVAKSSAKRYDEEKAAARKAASTPVHKPKGKGRLKANVPPPSPRNAPFERLRKLFQSNLAGFGMAQISLSLWHALREKVNGVNLSSATSEAIPPPARTLPDLPEEIPESKPDSKKDQPNDSRNSKNGRGDSRGQRGGRGAPKKQKESQRNKSPEAHQGRSNAKIAPPAILPDDEPLNWEREILSPGEVIKKIYPEASRNDVNRPFIGEDEAITLEGRVGEAVIRAWISSVVAEKCNSEIQNVPIVQPSRLTDKELNFFAKSMVTKWKVLGETAPVRKLQLADFEEEDGMLKSNNYDTKVRASKHQYITYEEDGVEKRLYPNRPGQFKPKHIQLVDQEDWKPEPPSRDGDGGGDWGSSRGRGGGRGRGRGRGRNRQGQVREYGEETSEFQGPSSSAAAPGPKLPIFDLPEDIKVTVYGREETTRTDVERDLFLLRLLEGRGSLHGPKYKDCAFIRRVWFPTQAQIDIGAARKLKKTSPAVRRRGDWVNDPWDDDTDDEEVALKKAIVLEEGDEDQDDETEDENIGTKDPFRGIELPKKINLNPSQAAVVARVVAPNPNGRTRATLVHGPPGTGKTSTIAAAVVIFAEIGESAWIVAQSNVGVKNVAEKLKKVGFDDFTLLIAQDYHTYWEERYKSLQGHYFPTSALKRPVNQKKLFGSKAVLCTLATLSSPALEKYGVFIRIPLRHLIIDEASQIDMTSEFMHLFYKHRSTLQSVCWFGDPKQLPPFGWSEGTEIRDIFKVEHLLANSKLLNVSYRLPVPIAEFISRAVYGGELKADVRHKVQLPHKAIVFVDVPHGKEESGGGLGHSWKNMAEAEVLLRLVETYYERPLKQDWEDQEKMPNYAIITPFEGQRALLADELKKTGSNRQVFNVDSFQGNEADYIITTIAKTGGPGFLASINRVNVLLTRCQRGLVVITQKDFVSRAGGLLRGLWFSLEPYDPWVSGEDVMAGYVDMPGSPAPNVRPLPSPTTSSASSMGEFPSRENMPPRPGANSQTSAVPVAQQGTPPTSPLVTGPITATWDQWQGVDYVEDLSIWAT